MLKVIWGFLLALAFSVMIVAGCIPANSVVTEKKVTVGNKNFTEQYIIGQMIAQVLQNHGFDVNLVSDFSSMDLREGLESDEIDICAEYTGTAWMVHLAYVYEPGIDNNDLYDLVKQEEAAKGFICLNPIWNNNTYAFASWPEFTTRHNLHTLSDLASLYRGREGEIDTFVGLEFSIRPDGLSALQKHYNFQVEEQSLITGNPGDSTVGLEKGQCEVAMVFGTDAAIAINGWRLYLDDKSFFPPYDLTPYVRNEVVKKYPEITAILNDLVETFPGGCDTATPEIIAQCQQTWQELNAKVDIENEKPEKVAREYLIKHQLIKN